MTQHYQVIAILYTTRGTFISANREKNLLSRENLPCDLSKQLPIKFFLKIKNSDRNTLNMSEQAREPTVSGTESLLNDSLNVDGEMTSMSFADDSVLMLNDSVFSNDSTSELLANVTNITGSVTDVSESMEEESVDRSMNEELAKAFNTGGKRFERAIGNRIINGDVIKLNPVSRKYIT